MLNHQERLVRSIKNLDPKFRSHTLVYADSNGDLVICNLSLGGKMTGRTYLPREVYFPASMNGDPTVSEALAYFDGAGKREPKKPLDMPAFESKYGELARHLEFHTTGRPDGNEDFVCTAKINDHFHRRTEKILVPAELRYLFADFNRHMMAYSGSVLSAYASLKKTA